MLKNKNIILGVCGSIASYKAAELIRLLVKAGANVKVIMTKEATQFITPLTLSTLSKHPVFIDYYKPETGEWNNHVELGLWADVLLVAPVTANSLAKFANGFCDNLLNATYLSARCKVMFAPAMDVDMWKHPSTQINVKKLLSIGNELIMPEVGELASGLYGEGRLAEPSNIVDYLSENFQKKLDFHHKKVLITAGPTYEAIDPVRFIGNHSSGRMGYALAEGMADLGANVTLISGPTSLSLINNNINRIDILSAKELYEECHKHFKNCDVCIMSAAVADYSPKVLEKNKIKKNDDGLILELVKTRDILSSLGEIKKEHQILIGFALETEQETENALKKLKNKNLDFIVLNSLNDPGAGFKSDTNKITIIDKNNLQSLFDLKSKKEVAKDIINKILELI